MQPDLASAILDLSEILEREREALRVMDVARVTALAEKKQQCMLILDAATPEERKKLKRADIQRVLIRARDNQRLLAHARACIRGALSQISGKVALPGQSAAPVAIRLNVRG